MVIFLVVLVCFTFVCLSYNHHNVGALIVTILADVLTLAKLVF